MDYSQEKYQIAKKEVSVAFIMWFFLGGFGGHRFYCKKPFGELMLVLMVLGLVTAIFLIGFFIIFGVLIWWVIDAFKLEQWVTEYNLNLLNSLSPKKSE